MVTVRVYKRRGRMERELTRLYRQGWKVVSQSGSFSSNMLTASLFSRSKVVVTLERP